MIKSALCSIGFLATFGGFGVAGSLFLVALGNPAPSASSDHAPLFWSAGGVGLAGIAMIVGGCFL